jgi:hypothetical protein
MQRKHLNNTYVLEAAAAPLSSVAAVHKGDHVNVAIVVGVKVTEVDAIALGSVEGLDQGGLKRAARQARAAGGSLGLRDVDGDPVREDRVDDKIAVRVLAVDVLHRVGRAVEEWRQVRDSGQPGAGRRARLELAVGPANHDDKVVHGARALSVAGGMFAAR